VKKNLRYDHFDLEEEDEVSSIYGKYTIKGVKELVITTKSGIEKIYKAIGKYLDKYLTITTNRIHKCR